MPYADNRRQIEGKIKRKLMEYSKERYPKAHIQLIPSTNFALLPYDLYFFYDSVFRAIELKVDDYEVQPHQYLALYEVVRNRGFAFVVRYLNDSYSFMVDNLTNGDTVKFNPDPSERQLGGHSTKDVNELPASAKTAYFKTINYIMSFSVSPIEMEIQKVIAENYQKAMTSSLAKKAGTPVK